MGVTFGTYHSFDDFGLILTHFEMGIPKAKTSSLEIEGADGVIDTTNALSEIVRYSNRVLSFTFETTDIKDWYSTGLSNIISKIHGKKLNIILDNDEQHYYVGRIEVEAKSDNVVGEVSIICDCEPYKLALKETTLEYIDTSVATINYNGTMVVVPTLMVDGAVELILGDVRYSLASGENLVPDFLIKNGLNEFSFEGVGTVTLTYREGAL